jgi:hypothetical protein
MLPKESEGDYHQPNWMFGYPIAETDGSEQINGAGKNDG